MFAFGLFTQVRDSGPQGPLVSNNYQTDGANQLYIYKDLNCQCLKDFRGIQAGFRLRFHCICNAVLYKQVGIGTWFALH